MEVKTIVITGASDGIGACAAKKLKELGHNVIIVGRNPLKTKKVAEEINVNYYIADYAKLADVVSLVNKLNKLDRIDVLLNNAGAAMDKRKETIDGFEQTFQVNVLAPFLLTYLLLDKLCQSKATVVQTSSIAANIFAKFDIDDLLNTKDYSILKAYGNAKLCNVLFTRQLHKRYYDKGINAVAFQPGIPRTNFASESSKFLNFMYHSVFKYIFTMSKQRSAKRLVYFALAKPEKDFKCGQMYTYKKTYKIKFNDKNGEISEKLWNQCLKMTKDYIK